jgi:hypothetical protein
MLVSLLVVVVLLAGVVAGFWWLRRAPLGGRASHDFGVVLIEGRSRVVEHTFDLANRTREPVTIAKVIPSCGCTAVDLETPATLAPGEHVDVTVALTLGGTGVKRKSIDLMLEYAEQERPMKLWVQATGQKMNPLSATRTSLDIEPGGAARMTLRHESLEGDETPPAPELIAPEGFEVSFQGWRRAARSKNPIVWNGAVLVRLSDEQSIPPSGRLTVSLGEQKRLLVQLVTSRAPSEPAG